MRSDRAFTLVMLVVFAIIGGILTVVFTPLLNFETAEEDVAALDSVPLPTPPRGTAEYLPPLPNEAPSGIRDRVLQGFDLVRGVETAWSDDGQTNLAAEQSEAATMGCDSCHFDGGLTDGGQDGGISLVGAAAQYPQVGPDGKILDLTERVNRCLRLHMGQPALRSDDPKMARIEAYLLWISQGVPIYSEAAWLGLAPLEMKRDPDLASAKTAFDEHCSDCHGPSAKGGSEAPPLAGSGSFLSTSDMDDLETLARFILDNMPRQNTILSPSTAYDLAAFVLDQPRPSPADDN